MRTALLLVAFLLSAGCIQVETPTRPETVPDTTTTLVISVVDESSGQGLSGAKALLSIPGKGVIRKTTDSGGQASFTLEPAPACTLTVERPSYQGGAATLSCLEDAAFRLPLKAGSSSPPAPTRPVVLPGGAGVSNTVPTGSFLLSGTVLSISTNAPVEGATVRLDAPEGPTLRTGADGAFAFAAAPGPHLLSVESLCWQPATVPVEVDDDEVALDIRLTASQAPTAPPSGVRATGGPGPGMVTISWQPQPGAAGYLLLRGGQPLLQLGNSLAYGIPGAVSSDGFAVAATDACGNAGPASAEVSAAPLPGVGGVAPTSVDAGADVGEGLWEVLASDGSSLGQRRWRTVEGTGNCCENYLTTTPSGLILDQGGSTLAFSSDEGKSWRGVLNPLILLAGEGSVTPAPDGDIVAFDWATYNADTAFSYRYSAATGTWESAPVPKMAGYDRPWIAVIKGPFEIAGLVVPYVTVVEGGIGVKDPLLVSYDGLHYLPSNSLLPAGEATLDLGSLLLQPDANRDWLGPMAEFDITPVDNGVGLLGKSAGMQGTPMWANARQPQWPGQVLRVDSAGALHAIDVAERSIVYSVSHDGGAHWTAVSAKLPDGWSAGEWDFRASAVHDQAVFAVNADVGNNVKQAAFRFRGLAGTPYLAEVLMVGEGDGVFGSGVAETGNRFDFMTLGFLPDGRIVMSAADAQHDNPYVAIELA